MKIKASSQEINNLPHYVMDISETLLLFSPRMTITPSVVFVVIIGL